MFFGVGVAIGIGIDKCFIYPYPDCLAPKVEKSFVGPASVPALVFLGEFFGVGVGVRIAIDILQPYGIIVRGEGIISSFPAVAARANYDPDTDGDPDRKTTSSTS